MERRPESEGDQSVRLGRIALVVGVAIAALASAGILMAVHNQQKLDAAEEQVVAWCSRLDADKTATKRWRRWPDPTLPESDPWGHPLRVRYREHGLGEELTVSSDGPDGKEWTRDDIRWQANNVEWLALAKQSAEAVEAVAGAATRGIVGGAIEGVTDHLPKGVRDSLGIPSERDTLPEKPPEKPPAK